MGYSKLGMEPTFNKENILLSNYLTGALNKARGLWKIIVCECNYRLYHDGDTHGAEIHFWALDYNPAFALSRVEGVGVRHGQQPCCYCEAGFEGSGRCAGDARVHGFWCCLFLIWVHCFTGKVMQVAFVTLFTERKGEVGLKHGVEG